MTIYRVYLLGRTGKIEAIQRFSAASDKIALAIARGMANEDFLGSQVLNYGIRADALNAETGRLETAPRGPRSTFRAREARCRLMHSRRRS